MVFWFEEWFCIQVQRATLCLLCSLRGEEEKGKGLRPSFLHRPKTKETLRDYVKHFNAMLTDESESKEHVALAAFQQDLTLLELTHSYNLNEVSTLTEALERANKYIIVDELDEAKIMM